MKKYILNHIKIALIGLFIFYPQGAFSSATTSEAEDDYLCVGTQRVRIERFVQTIFSQAFDDEKRARILVQLSRQAETNTLYKNPHFQAALKSMEEKDRNTFISSLPFDEQKVLKPHLHWSLLASLGQSELSKAGKSIVAPQEENLENVEDLLSSLDNPSLRAFFDTLFSPDILPPPSHDASFLEHFFYQQRGKGKILSDQLAILSASLEKAEPFSTNFYDLTGAVNFLGKSLYAANNQKDHLLEEFPDDLLFCFSHDLAHLELTYYFLRNVAERENRKVDALTDELERETDDSTRQKHLKALLNTTMLKREIVAASAFVLGDFLSLDDKEETFLLNYYILLGNFFQEYNESTINPQTSWKLLPTFHTKLCTLTSGLGIISPDLLDMGFPLSDIESDGSTIGGRDI
ncbi:MAG: hypothetical protein GW748_01075 [Alphaproteobacteria bacterium]|nr:hypothetical protein [Alphaproteobacteria bacterium]NCQ66325.1 hypothetical protein [Alphaproteobacteria bacterium]NCT06811.1 hypothetical protein [Alphaproteobacteria bacterium]